ncbi:MAG: hypothetical protein J6P71_01485 [Oscillospiraceae bacterium]|nr:hypothetical protein [Oscillospiraceae bacterium]
MKKGAPLAQILVFVIFIAAFAVLNLVTPARTFSEQENRYLAQAPKFSFSALFDGSFTESFEKYVTDQFFGRDLWVAGKARAERAAGKTENNNVFFCADDTLIERFNEPDPAQLTANIDAINALAANTDADVCLALIPGAAAIWSDRLPANANCADQLAVIDEVYSRTDAKTIDLASALTAAADEYIYYRTDHHWTSLGACYASDRILSAITGRGGKAPQNFAPKTVTTEFYGTAWSSSGATWVPPDSIDIFVPQGDAVVKNYPHGTEEDGTLYDMSRLETKDKYSMFCGGNTPRLHVDTGSEGPHLLVLRDSYFDSELPFLLGSFSEIDVLDLRYFRTSVADFIRENDIDAVLVIYSVSNFSTDTSVFLAGR